LKEELEVAISELPDNYITAKRKLREDYNPQILQINNELLDYKKTRADLEIGLVSTGVDVGPAIYLARTFGTDLESAEQLQQPTRIFVFDPLAVMFVIAYNQALMDRKKDEPVVISEPTGFTALQELEEDNERMDIIGQNGNDGLHYDEVDIPNEPLEENDPKEVNPQPTAKGGVRVQ
jgi:hypothetical protein